ncbi:MAG: tripartite tricarboxylate transporter substrate binding protein [Alphaproteobacteria bacterium]|nr:tripartite tricarboxylate transporter substrate binding protein [Alphaproteobacteria bacterium]
MRSALRAFALAILIALTLPSLVAHAQGWPNRPVTLIVPFPAGGNADVLARALAAELSEKLGQNFIVDNRTGAGGNIGGAAVAKAPADGYTMMFGTPGPIATNKLMFKSLPYDPEKDLVPVVLVARSPLIVVAHPSFPAKDLKELIAYAKANPGKVNAGNPGNGTLGHITSELLQQHSGIKMTHVPYRGTPPLTTDVLGGQIDVGFDFLSTYIPLVKDGKLRALAVTSRERVAELPDVMTVEQAGFAGFEASAWYAIVAPKGTPAEPIDKVNRIANDYLKSPKGKAQLATFVMQAAGGSPQDLAAYIKSELAKWGPIIKAANISM